MLGLVRSCESDDIWDEWGRGGSEWAETLGKWSWKVQEGYGIPPGALGQHKKFKNDENTPKSKNAYIYIYIYIYNSRSTALAAAMLEVIRCSQLYVALDSK